MNAKLKTAGIKDGDTVRIGTIEFEYIDEDLEDEPDDYEGGLDDEFQAMQPLTDTLSVARWS